MKGRKILLAFIISAITLTSGCANGTSKTEEAKSEQKTTEENGVVPIKPITAKAIDDNPYMAKSDANVHQDCYNSDTTDEVLPVDIYPEINVSYEKVNPNASPAVFFDTYGHAVVPFQGGLAIRDINADETQTEGYFSPAKHDGGGYVIQSSYSFVDESNRLVCPTSNNHGYVQDLESGMWQFIMLDFETGETAFTMDVSDKPGYNNMAIGMYAGNSGNTLYCPTGYLELLRLQDRFVYLPEMPYRKVDLDKAKRNVLTQEEFTEAGGKGNVAGWLNTITVENVHPNTTVAIRMKGIAGKADTFTLYAYDKENKLKEVPAELWHIQEEDGTLPDKLTEDTLYEVHVMVEDGGEFDLSDTEKEIKIAVILGNK